MSGKGEVGGKPEAAALDVEKMRAVLPLWYAVMAWAKELLVHAFDLERPQDVLKRFRGQHVAVPGTNWWCYPHGKGVGLYKTPEVGGIDFDFDQPTPDAYRFKMFFCKQYNDGQLDYTSYHPLANDEERLETAIAAMLQEEPTPNV